MIYLLVSIIIFNLIAFFIPKRLSKIEMYTISIFSMLFAICTDVILDLKYHLYWYFSIEPDWKSFIILFGTYPSVAIIYLNYFPFTSDRRKKIIYILWWSVFVTLFEWGTFVAEILHYRKWNIVFSAVTYPLILAVVYWNFLWIRKLARSSR